MTAPSSTRPDDLTSRITLMGAGSVLFSLAMLAYVVGNPPVHREVVILTAIAYGMAFALFICAFVVRSTLWQQALAACGLLFALVSSFYISVSVVNHGYGTDTLAMLHVAAEEILQGRNPYELKTDDIAGQLQERFGIPPDLITLRPDGRPIERPMAYPSLAALLFVPFIRAGLRDLRWVVLGAQIVAWAMLYVRAPPGLRALIWIPMALELNLFILFTQGSVLDWLWVVPMLVCAFALAEARNDAAALAFGTAAAIKQVPWLAAPFLAVWLWHSGRGSGREGILRTLRFSALSAGAFAVYNLPFIVWNFDAWFQGVMEPISSPLVVLGSGLSLVTDVGLSPLPREFYAVAQGTIVVAALVVYHVFFARMKHGLWTLLPIVYWFGFRSLHNYLVYWIPLALSGLISWHRQRDETPTWAPKVAHGIGRTTLTRGGLGGLFIIVVASGFSHWRVPGRVDVKVTDVRDEFAVGVPTSVAVVVSNLTEGPLVPNFWVSWGPFSFPWRSEGPGRLSPTDSANYVLRVASPIGLPPLKTAAREGQFVYPEPFVVKVNDTSSSVFFASDSVRPRFRSPVVLNPRFHFWDQRGSRGYHTFPLHWTNQSWAPQGDASSVEEDHLDGMHAVRLTVVQDGRAGKGAHGEWADAALIQRIPFPSCPLAFSIYPTFRYGALGGWPRLALSLQVIDGRRSVWMVFAADGTASYGLPNGTRILTIPSPIGTWSRHKLDAGALFRELDWITPRHLFVKIAVSAHASMPGRYAAYVGEITGVSTPDCAAHARKG